MRTPASPLDERVPPRILGPLAAQHLLVMISGPVSSAFLLSRALHLTPQAGARLLSALFLLSGLGTVIQSLGPWRVGARLPFVMLPGGAAVALFIQIAQATDPATATGAVLVTGLFLLIAAPAFTILMRFFPTVVLGTMVVVIGLNLVKITAGLLAGAGGVPSAGSLGLAGLTILATALGHRFLPDPWRRCSVMIGIAVGTAAAALAGRLGPVAPGPLVSWPALLPFGAPVFDPLATIPLLLFGVGAMAEAAGQTVLNAEAVGRPLERPEDRRRYVARTIRGDAVTSLVSGLLGGPLMVTSGENIGIVRLSGVRSRMVTLATGVLLAVIAFLAPVSRVISAVPSPVVGGAGLVVFAMIIALGIGLLHDVDPRRDGGLMVATLALTAGVLPIVDPPVYLALPPAARLVLGSGVTMAALVGVLANLLLGRRDEPPADAPP